jgi:hypothetical protein
MKSARTVVAVQALFLGAALVACSKKEEPKDAGAAPPSVAAQSTRPSLAPTAVAPAPIGAGIFNKAFPKDGQGGYARVFAPDKEGYAEAKLLKEGKEVAVISVADAERLAYARAKYGSATERVDDFPVLQSGTNQTSALVRERYVVKVVSSTLDHEARKAILATFDLKSL